MFVGSLIDPFALDRGLGWLGLVLALVVVAKVAVIYLLARLARISANTAQLAVGLGQIGEFSFVLASAALAVGAITTDLYAALLAAVVISIAVSAVLARLAGHTPAHALDAAGMAPRV